MYAREFFMHYVFANNYMNVGVIVLTCNKYQIWPREILQN